MAAEDFPYIPRLVFLLQLCPVYLVTWHWEGGGSSHFARFSAPFQCGYFVLSLSDLWESIENIERFLEHPRAIEQVIVDASDRQHLRLSVGEL